MPAPNDPSSVTFNPIPPPSPTAQPWSISIIPLGSLRGWGGLFVEGYEGDVQVDDFAFLLEREGKRVLWDLGLRKDLAFPDKDLRQSALNFNGQSSLSALDALRSQSPPIEPESIDSVAFSHTHFDHVGDVGEFPKNVGVIVGPRDKEGEVGRKELAKELQVNEGVLEGREIRVLSRERDAWQDVGPFKGVDLFSDGSFFLLDTPGHHPGSITALILVATNPHPMFYALAGDTAHHISLLRGGTIGTYKAKKNPMKDVKGEEGEKTESFEVDLETSQRTMSGVARLDMQPNVVVFLGHDHSVGQLLGLKEGEVRRLKGDEEEMRLLKERKEEDKFGRTVDGGVEGKARELKENLSE